jgi:outer membrane protein assembly factor BamB
MQILSLVLPLLLSAAPPAGPAEALWSAARSGDTAAIAAALDRGADVNARSRYEATALFYAADRGHLEAVRLLLARGADANLQDTFYRMRPIDLALGNGHVSVALLLLEKGSRSGGHALRTGVEKGDATLVRAALAAPDLDRAALQSALLAAEKEKRAEIAALVKAALDARPAEAGPAYAVDPATLSRYAGRYRSDASGLAVAVDVRNGQLVAETAGQPPMTLVPTAEGTFRVAQMEGTTVVFAGRAGSVETMTVQQPAATTVLAKMAAPDTAAPPVASAPAAAATGALAPAARTAPRPWPSFRGEGGAGNGDGQGAVVDWDLTTGRHVSWKTPIPGIANSSPIVWGEKVFVTTAVSRGGDATFRTGLYGDVKPVDDLSEHEFKLYCLDKGSGRVLWERTAHAGAPRVKRHTKASQANSTPATDGRRVVALFGSVGLLVAWDLEGRELWRADTGVLDSGWFFDATYQWGHASSPIIHQGSVIVQADVQERSFVAAWDLGTGRLRWRTEREGVSSWGTPAIVSAAGRDELVTNGTKVRAYDPATGALLSTLGPNSEVTVATPIVRDGVVYVTGGYPPVRPVYAIKAGARGDISLPAGRDSSEAVAWSNTREGTYIPTPILYGDWLFTCGNNGIVTVYDARTGQRLARTRVGAGGAFSASPVAADGKLYFANEDGEVHVVTADAQLAPVARNDVKEPIMATPAISDGLIVLRTLGHVYGLGRPAGTSPPSPAR